MTWTNQTGVARDRVRAAPIAAGQWAVALLAVCLSACNPPGPASAPTLPTTLPSAATAAPRINGGVGSPNSLPPAEISNGTPQQVATSGLGSTSSVHGNVSLDFADTDIREAVAQILGVNLHVNYTIDPAVRGTVTLRTVIPLNQTQLLPTLQALLAQVSATVVQDGALYRVVPSNTPEALANLAGSSAATGSSVVPVRYADAGELARVLQPFVGASGRIVASPGANAVLISGDPSVRATLIEMVSAFDVNILAGQSFALLPTPAGGAKDFAASLQDAFRTQGGPAGQTMAAQVRVVPMDRINSVLVVAPQSAILDQARRVYALIERQQRLTLRSWHVLFLQNSHANDSAYVLQQAFTPNAVTAQPSGNGQTQPGTGTQQNTNGARLGAGAGAGAGAGSGTLASSLGNLGSSAGVNGTLSGQAGAGGTIGSAGVPSQGTTDSVNPLLGGLDTSGTGADTNTMRIIPNPQNNALLIYATPQEEDTVEAMLRKIDILPLQVRIDATIAEVTLNDQLQYGTQFFFKAGGINGILNTAAGQLGNPVATVLNTAFPGFVVSGNGQGGAPLALQALQAVTTVHVLSSPEVLVLDNQPAHLQVGNLVPYLTSSSQSSLVSGAPVINSVNYQPTGVILQVTPRVNSGGLVTLDVSQEVSGVDTTATTANGIQSPTFTERQVTSRVVVQDGQTIGLAGLITDSITRGNAGIPFLKDIPLLGFFAGNQNNVRERTELLVLITPHVLHDQRDATALTQDLEEQLPNAARVPEESLTLKPSGSDDPGRGVRHFIRQKSDDVRRALTPAP